MVFRPEVIATIVEKFCSMRHFCKRGISDSTEADETERHTSATAMNCFRQAARRRESSLFRMDSATQSAICTLFENNRVVKEAMN